RGKPVERALAREILGLLWGDLCPDLALEWHLTVHEGQLTARVDEIAAANCGHVGSERCGHLGHFEPKLGDAIFYDSHGYALLFRYATLPPAGPSMICTSSQPCAPQLLRIAASLCSSSGVTKYSHLAS